MEKPAWLDRSNIKITLDARPLLASGVHPLEQVIKDTAGFSTGEIYEIITPFPPVPMIGKLEASGFASYMETEEGIYRTFFVRL
jgi:hypothetical protein